MGFDRRRSRDSSQSDESDSRDDFRPSNSRQSDAEQDLPGPTPYGKYGLDRAADYYGVEFDSAETVMRVRRLEKCHGRSVHEWLDEGIPVGAMGTPSKMEAYRERKDSPIPWDIEDLNEDSEERNTRRIKRLRREKPNPDGRTSLSNRLRDVVSSPGQSLDEPIQRAMEDRIGDSFGDVRVHTGPKAAGTAEQINARAFTVGNHIVFNHGEYDPESAEGQRVLAHELAHVRQQTGGALSMLPQEEVALEIDPDPELEREAEETAQRVMAGGELDIQRLPMRTTEVHVQRTNQVPPTTVPSDVANDSVDKVKEFAEEKVDEQTRKKYHLTKEQLREVAVSISSVEELEQFISEKGIEATSSLQESASGGMSGALKGGKLGMSVGGLPGLIAGAPLGYILSTKYGKDVADRIQSLIRKEINLDTDQEFDVKDSVRSGKSQRGDLEGGQ